MAINYGFFTPICSGKANNKIMSHIALFIPTLEAGGAERVFITLAERFLQYGHQVDIVLINKKGPLLKQCSPQINIIDLKAFNHFFGQFGYVGSTVFKLSLYLFQKKPDVLLSTLTGSNISAVFAHKLSLSKSKLILREASSLSNVKNSLRLFLMRKVYNFTSHIICLSETMKNDLIQCIHISPKKISIIANPVETRVINQKSKEEIAPIWDNDDIKFIITIGRLTPAKDHKTLLLAFSLAYKKNNTLRLVILGEGENRQELEALIRKLSIQYKVYMPGYEENPYRWLSKAQVFILTSRWEGYPNSLIEAMAIGIPIITTQYDASITEIVQPYKQVAIAPVGDHKKIAELILKNSNTRLNKTPYALSIKDITEQYLNLM